MEVEDFDDLGQGVAQGVVQPGREHQDPQAQGRARQCIGHRRFHLLAAARAPVAMNRMLGHFGRDILGNIFDQPLARMTTTRHRTLTVRTTFERMFFAMVDVRRSRSPTARMAFLASRFSFPLLGRGLLVNGPHARRSGRPRVGSRALLRQHFGQREQGKHRSLGPLREDVSRLCSAPWSVGAKQRFHRSHRWGYPYPSPWRSRLKKLTINEQDQLYLAKRLRRRKFETKYVW